MSDSKSVAELEIDWAELQLAKQKIGTEKQAIVGQLSELNAKCSKKLPAAEYHKLKCVRGELVKQLSEIETEIGAINTQRTVLQAALQVRKDNNFGRTEIRQIVAVRDKWHGFSMDPINHQKAREASWKFSQELGEVLKQFFNL